MFFYTIRQLVHKIIILDTHTHNTPSPPHTHKTHTHIPIHMQITICMVRRKFIKEIFVLFDSLIA